MHLDYVKFYNEMKRLTFPDGYLLCLPEDGSYYTINAVVFHQNLGNGSFNIQVNGRSVDIERIPMPAAFVDVAARLTVHDQPFAVKFESPSDLRNAEQIIQCYDDLTGKQIGCAYHLAKRDYDFGSGALSSEMKRVSRTDNESYYRFTGYDDSRKLLGLFKKVIKKNNISILDWGVGAGRVASHLRRLDEVDVFGTDIDPVNMDALHNRGWPRDNFKLMAPGGDIPFGDAIFDACFGISVFTHLTEKLQFKYLGEIARVLKPGGVGVFSTHGMLQFFSRINDGNLLSEWVGAGIHVTGNNYDISENFAEADEKTLYVDTLHTSSYIFEKWTEFFSDIRILAGQNVPGHDLIVCRKAP
ncbi:class I SAM-dependent methyltransferase [Methylobacterium sp. Leaf466]|uniref:class I SAM-dependent methyltransferase n=1 Tax=Methylobacterium sp. Leaf466 TaxID=1736386 RepID=UPI00138F7672|nr:class I SAM-dependent methyltransferase [Methylobacterium sp. Leaf466]